MKLVKISLNICHIFLCFFFIVRIISNQRKEQKSLSIKQNVFWILEKLWNTKIFPFWGHIPTVFQEVFGVIFRLYFRRFLGSYSDFILGGFGGGFDDPYIKRKELIKSGLLLGAGVIKGALVTTLINQVSFPFPWYRYLSLSDIGTFLCQIWLTFPFPLIKIPFSVWYRYLSQSDIGTFLSLMWFPFSVWYRDIFLFDIGTLPSPNRLSTYLTQSDIDTFPSLI